MGEPLILARTIEQNDLSNQSLLRIYFNTVSSVIIRFIVLALPLPYNTGMKAKTHAYLIAGSILIAVLGTYMTRARVTTIDVPDVPLKGPVVLELFTSQGCSSCPPADQIFSTLAKRPNIIGLSCHVTYWNQLGWNDTFSQQFCTDRQRNYSDIRYGRGAFTPEIVVNGMASVIGSRGADIGDLLKRYDGRVFPIAIHPSSQDGPYSVALPDHPAAQNHPVSIEVISFGRDVTVPIGRGENSGLNITYTRPVEKISVLPNKWDGIAQTMAIPKDDLSPDAFGFAVLVLRTEGPSKGTVLAAGQYLSGEDTAKTQP